MMNELYDPVVFLTFMLRVIGGILFFFQGFDKIFNIGLKNVVATISPAYVNKGFPLAGVQVITFLTSWVELVAGFLLILGLFKIPAIYLLGIDLIVVVTSMSIINPVWDMKLVFPRLFLLVLLLLLPLEKDILSIDHLLKSTLH